MNIYSLPAIISFTVNFSTAFIVLMENPRATLHRWFAAFIFSFAVWNLAEILMLNSADLLPAMLGAQILYRVIFLTPAFYVIISYLFPKNLGTFATRPIFYVAVFSLPVLGLCLSFPDFQIELVSLKEALNIYHYHLTFNLNPVFLFLLLVSLSYIVWGSVVLVMKIKHLRTIRLKNQTRFFVSGMVFIFVGFIAIILLKASLRNPASFYWLSTIFTFIVALFFLITIMKFHLFKPGKMLSGGMTYTILSAATLSVYFFVVRAASTGLESWIGIDSYMLNAALIVALIFAIVPFEKRLRRLFDRLLNRDLHQQRGNILALFRELQGYHERSAFFEIIERFLVDNLKSSAVFIFDYRPEVNQFVESHADGTIPPVPESSSLVRELKRKKGVAEFYEITHTEESHEYHKFLEDVHARFLVPLTYAGNLMAIVVLCRKKYGLEYNENEKEILSILGSEVAASLRRNQMIEEMRVKDRQRFQVEKLASVGQLAASLAHEIRNPLNTISTSAQTLLQKSITEIDRKNLMRFIIEEAGRLNRILEDFLSLARIGMGTLVPIDMEGMFDRLCLELKNLDDLDIPVSYEITTRHGGLVSDPDLLFQALLNLGINARAAIRERCSNDEDFTCTDGMIQCVVSADTHHFIVSVTDNGIGISPDARKLLYDPFFTTREKGTGLGLSIVHQIVAVLSGSIEFASRPGHTRFSILLPRKTAE
jgi:signal transduction histidine kinase